VWWELEGPAKRSISNSGQTTTSSMSSEREYTEDDTGLKVGPSGPEHREVSRTGERTR